MSFNGDREGTDARPTLVLVGGFLGAGKTTLIACAARMLSARGLRVGVITNDQGADLVDTRLFAAAGLPVGEVPGGCFCCRLSDLLATADRLLASAPLPFDILFAEPVGSCTDLVATVVHPLLRECPERFRVAPLTVVVDSARLRAFSHVEGRSAAAAATADADSDLAYLYGKQFAEADIVCFNKCDDPRARLTSHATSPISDVPGYAVSARTGRGVEAWLADVLGSRMPGLRTLEIDYARYAAAEAALGWLNWHASLTLDSSASPLSPAMLCGPLLEDLDRALSADGIAISHLKLFAQAPTGFIKASLCANGDEPIVDGTLHASPARDHALIINLRAEGDPRRLAEIVGAALARLARAAGGALSVVHQEAFRPSPPRPERRVRVRAGTAAGSGASTGAEAGV